MARVGSFCFPETGHLTPTLAVMAALAARGHDVVVFTVPDMIPAVQHAGLRAHVIGAGIYPAGTHGRRRAAMGAKAGIAAAALSGHYSGLYTEAVMQDGARAVEAESIDLLVIDQADVGGHSVAHVVGVPFITIALCLIMNEDEAHPVWALEPARDGARLTPANRVWRAIFEHLFAPQRARIDRFRARHGLRPLSDLSELWSPLAQVSQQPEGFEFPRPLPAHLHFAGPFTNARVRRRVDFPWDRLDGRPIIYAAFGSLVNGDAGRIDAIARACHDFEAQLVLQLDGGAERLARGLPGGPIVVPFAPQVELLARSTLMITHAGLNSTLECLSAGVPMVAVPLTNDEPGIGARIEHTGTGIVVPPGANATARLRDAVGRLLTDGSYRAAAERFRRWIARRDGATHAAELICAKTGIQ